MNTIFVSMPSKGIFTRSPETGNWEMTSIMGVMLADLHLKYPGAVFIAPSIQNYAILPHLEGKIGPTYQSWKDRCRTLIDVCDMLIVMKVPHWDESVGVKDEIEYARAGKLPVFFYTVDGQIGNC